MIFVLGGLSLLVLWGGGALLLGLAGLRKPNAPTTPAAAFAAGVSLLALLGMLTVILGGHVTLLAGYALFTALAVAHLAWRPRPSWPSLPRLPTARPAGAVLAATALLLSLLGLAASRDRLLWDGWALWTFKARVLFLEGTLPPALLDPAGPYPWTQPSYPLALPLVHWWGYAHAGGAIPALASLAGAACLLFVPLLLWRSLKHSAGPLWAAAAAFGCAAFWPMTRYAIGGYADVLITLAMLGAVVDLDGGLDGGLDGRPGDGLDGARHGATGRYAIFLTLGTLAKNEGLALAAVGALAGLLALGTGARRARSARWLLAPFIAIAPWFLFTRLRGSGAVHLGTVPSPAEVWSRVPTLLGAFVDLVTSPAWLPLLLLFVCGLLARAARRGHRGGPAWSLVLGYFAIVQAVYLATPLELPWLLATSLDRVIGTMVPAVVFLSIREIRRLGDGSLRAANAAPPPAAPPAPVDS